MAISAGSTFGNRYRLRDRIAVGGMGEVWRADDAVLGRVVAIKLLSPALASQSGFAQRFREEARHTAGLTHPNIAAVHDYGEDDGASWLVMELVNGRPLSQIIRDEGPMSPERTVKIIGQAADALQAAHDAGVIHRDVKPANILVRPDGVVKLTDFGIARAVDAAPLTRTGEVMGTAQYISPEQAMGMAVSPASDLYSLACVAYEMLTGRRIFDEGSAVATAMAHIHRDPPPLPQSVPAAVASLIMGTLAKDPVARPRSAREFAAALRGVPGTSYQSTQATQAVAPPVAGPTERISQAGAYGGAAAYGAAYGAGASYPPIGTQGYPTQPPSGPLGYPTQPPGSGPLGYPAVHDEPQRRNAALWVVPLVVVLVGGLVWAVMNGMFGSSPGTPTPSATSSRSASFSPSPTTTAPTTTLPTTTAPTNVEIVKANYVGKSAQAVSSALTKLGLVVRMSDVDSSDPAGTVVAIDPYGAVSPGTVITLSVSKGPQSVPASSSSSSSSSAPASVPPGSPGASQAASPAGLAGPAAPATLATVQG